MTCGCAASRNVTFENTGYSESVSKEAQVPTLAMQAGNLSASPTSIYDPLTGNADGTGRTPFAGKIIPANRIDAGVKNFLNLGGWGPNQPGGGAFGLSRNFVTSAPNYQWRRQYDEKFNWNPTDRLSTFVRFGMMDHNANTNGVFGALGGKPISRANTGAGFVQGHLFQGTISATYVVTPSLIVDGAYGYFREDFNDIPPRGDQNLGFTVFQVPGLQTTDKRELGWPLILIDGFEQIGAPNNLSPTVTAIRSAIIWAILVGTRAATTCASESTLIFRILTRANRRALTPTLPALADSSSRRGPLNSRVAPKATTITHSHHFCWACR